MECSNMSLAAPEQESRSYRHEAFLYAGLSGFLQGTLPFIREAIVAGEPTLIMVNGQKIHALRRELRGDASRLRFADMAEVGANPARIIQAWRDFLTEVASPASRARGIGEPIWAGRTEAELEECQRHEALLNIVVADPGFWLMCPYDTSSLRPGLIDEARRSHPFVREEGISRTSGAFPGVDALAGPFEGSLPEPPPDAAALDFDDANLGQVRSFVLAQAESAGMSADRAAELALAVNEVATNSLLHGGGQGSLHAWRTPAGLVHEVRDQGHISDPLVGRERPAPLRGGGRGLWLANQLCELVQIRSTSTGVTVRLHARRP
jgi:anti-sigma regulatory factor (Ser/Thr protein kinase)